MVNHIDALPLGSNGSKRAMNPAPMNNAAATKIGTDVWRFEYSAIIGA